MARPELGAALVAWAAEAGRDLPWRHTRDPWAVLVSEVMLQQTQVIRAISRYPVFLELFADVATCAAASVGEVIGAWAGLGRNRRARDLHATARRVVEVHDGAVPDDLDALLALPGIGRYTARAVLAFAFERPVGVLDTNAARVLARAVAGRRLRVDEAQRLADASVPAGQSWAYNQAILDLGATVCTARPACPACPLAGSCRWAASGWAEPDPARRTAGSSGRQSPFAGSDRQGRGRLIAALVIGPVAGPAIPAAAGWPEDELRAQRVATTLVDDGLAVRTGLGGLALP